MMMSSDESESESRLVTATVEMELMDHCEQGGGIVGGGLSLSREDSIEENEGTTSSTLSSLPSTSSCSEDVQPTRAKRRLTTEEEDNGTARVMNGYEKHAMEVEEAMQRLVLYLVNDARIVDKVEDAKDIVDSLLENKDPVAVDCEGVNLGDKKTGKVTLVQVSDKSGTAYLFDVQVEPMLGDELKRLLESEEVVKVMHDCKSDSQGLHKEFGIKLNNIFDTQVAHRIIQKKNKAPQEQEDTNAGLDKVCRLYGGAPSPFKDSVKIVYKKQQNYWTQRPLTDLMISYAASDVLCLIPTVYKQLKSHLTSEEDKKLFTEICDQKINQVASNNPPQDNHRKNKGNGQGHGRGKDLNANGRMRNVPISNNRPFQFDQIPMNPYTNQLWNGRNGYYHSPEFVQPSASDTPWRSRDNDYYNPTTNGVHKAHYQRNGPYRRGGGGGGRGGKGHQN